MQALILGWLASHWLIVAAVVVGIAALANPVMVWKFKAWILLAVVAWWGWTGHAAHDALVAQVAKTEAALAVETAKASEAARKEEQARAAAVNAASAAYERGKRDAQAAADRVTADLRAGRERFRSMWAECQARPGGLPGAAAGPGEPDAGADDRAASAGRIVRAAAECDAQVRGLQAVVEADREQVNP